MDLTFVWPFLPICFTVWLTKSSCFCSAWYLTDNQLAFCDALFKFLGGSPFVLHTAAELINKGGGPLKLGSTKKCSGLSRSSQNLCNISKSRGNLTNWWGENEREKIRTKTHIWVLTPLWTGNQDFLISSTFREAAIFAKKQIYSFMSRTINSGLILNSDWNWSGATFICAKKK